MIGFTAGIRKKAIGCQSLNAVVFKKRTMKPIRAGTQNGVRYKATRPAVFRRRQVFDYSVFCNCVWGDSGVCAARAYQ